MISDDDFIGAAGFDAGRGRRCPSVGGADHVHFDVGAEIRAADTANADDFIRNAQFVDAFGNQFVGDTVSATGAVR